LVSEGEGAAGADEEEGAAEGAALAAEGADALGSIAGAELEAEEDDEEAGAAVDAEEEEVVEEEEEEEEVEEEAIIIILE